MDSFLRAPALSCPPMTLRPPWRASGTRSCAAPAVEDALATCEDPALGWSLQFWVTLADPLVSAVASYTFGADGSSLCRPSMYSSPALHPDNAAGIRLSERSCESHPPLRGPSAAPDMTMPQRSEITRR